MKTGQWGIAAFIIVMGTIAGDQPATAEDHAGKAFWKLTRGAINIVTGWVEVPKRMYETAQLSGTAAGFTWGTLRGLGYGFVRTAAGFYELFTFPFPAPPNYESVMDPEFVFVEDGAISSTSAPYRK